MHQGFIRELTRHGFVRLHRRHRATCTCTNVSNVIVMFTRVILLCSHAPTGCILELFLWNMTLSHRRIDAQSDITHPMSGL
jgi:hypothetical protein